MPSSSFILPPLFLLLLAAAAAAGVTCFVLAPPPLLLRAQASRSAKTTSRNAVPLELEKHLDPSREWEVELTLNGDTKLVKIAEGTSILEAAEMVFEDPPCDCRNGVCTTCAARVQTGEPGQNYRLATHGFGASPDHDEKFILSCQTYPCGEGLQVLLSQHDEVYYDQYGKAQNFDEPTEETKKPQKLFGIF
jgi:ferredoxin